jgi:hypothetical protein
VNAGAINEWLHEKRRLGKRDATLYAAATLIGGALVVCLTFYCIAWLTHWVIASVIIARDDLAFIPTWLLREYINIGPRLIFEGWPSVKRARSFAAMDIETSAGVLEFLANRAIPISRDELLKRFRAVAWEKLASDLDLLPGVIFFRPDGLRVTLTAPLRIELRRMLGLRSETEPEPISEPHELSPHEILGVAACATMSEIKTAYRTRIKECHPDRFACMDEQSRSLAEEWSKSLNAAYENLTADARHRSQT